MASCQHALLASAVFVAVVPFVGSELVALTAAQVAVAAVASFGAFETPLARSGSEVAGDGEFGQRFLCHAVRAFARFHLLTLAAAVASTLVWSSVEGSSGLPGIAVATTVG